MSGITLRLPVDVPELDALAPLVAAIADEFGAEPAYTGRLRSRGERFDAADEVADYLIDQGLVLDEGKDGALYVVCPWSTGHSSDSGVTEAAYFPAGTGGFDRGHFRCLHASCAARTDEDFFEAIGCGASADFEALPPIVEPTPDGYQLPIIDVSKWIDTEPPEQRYILKGWLMRGTAGMLVGEDGVGKSLIAQQAASCVAAGKPFLGIEVEKVPSLYITCEDDATQLWRRQRSINYALGLPIDCAPAVLSSLVGHTDVQLGHFDKRGAFVASKVLNGIAALAKAKGIGLIVLDNAAHFFPGNEIVRREVAAFCSALEWLALEADAAVLLLAHPSKTKPGDIPAEYSGSTAWSAHVRQRWFMNRPDRNNPLRDPDARILRKSKSNYSSIGDEIAFRWIDWAFKRDVDLDDAGAKALRLGRSEDDDASFLECLDVRSAQHRAVSENKASRTYAPKEFATMPEARGATVDRLERAMDRLYRLGAIERGFLWIAHRKPVEGLRRVSEERGDLCGDPAATGCGDLRRVHAATCGDTHLPPKGGKGAAPTGTAAPFIDTGRVEASDAPDQDGQS